MQNEHSELPPATLCSGLKAKSLAMTLSQEPITWRSNLQILSLINFTELIVLKEFKLLQKQ